MQAPRLETNAAYAACSCRVLGHLVWVPGVPEFSLGESRIQVVLYRGPLRRRTDFRARPYLPDEDFCSLRASVQDGTIVHTKAEAEPRAFLMAPHTLGFDVPPHARFGLAM